MNDKYYFSLLLHAHLPYVYHPEYPSFLEENWLFEAISETYIPLLQLLQRLDEDGVPCRLAISLSATLLAMLDHPRLQSRYQDYLKRQMNMCQTLIKSWECSSSEKDVLYKYLQFYRKNLELFYDYYQCDLISHCRKYFSKGMLELLCTGATHIFLPNFQQYPKLVRQQVKLSIATFEKYFGKQASLGFWLPECAYYEGLDKILVEEGVRYSYIALHGLQGSNELPHNGSFAPIRSPEGLIFFPRERASSNIIWDQQLGYPSAKLYRDFYQDVGYRTDETVLQEHLPCGLRYYTGIKLWRIEQERSPTGLQPCPYEPQVAAKLAEKHAGNFLEHLGRHSEKAADLMHRPPLISTAYDAELFGHWWSEGLMFLEHLFRLNHENFQNGRAADMEIVTPSQYLAQEHSFQIFRPCFSSWGQDGYAQVWLDQQNDWIYPQLFELYESIEATLLQNPMHSHGHDKHSKYEYGVYQQEAIKQLIREFSLACSSDWAFMMKSDIDKDYAIRRTVEHINNTFTILQSFANNKFNNAWLTNLRAKNRIFLGLDIEDFFL